MIYCHAEEPIQANDFIYGLNEQGELCLASEETAPNHPNTPINRYTFFVDQSDIVAPVNLLTQSIARRYSDLPQSWVSPWTIPEKATGRARELIEKRYAELNKELSADHWRIIKGEAISVAAKPFTEGSTPLFDRNTLRRARWRCLFLLIGNSSAEDFLANEDMRRSLRRCGDSGILAFSDPALAWLQREELSILYPASDSLDRIVLLLLSSRTLDKQRLAHDISIETITDTRARKLWMASFRGYSPC